MATISQISDDRQWAGMSEEQQIEGLRAAVLGMKSLITDMSQKVKTAGLEDAGLSLPDAMSNTYVFQFLPREDQLECLRTSMQHMYKKISEMIDVITALPIIEEQRTSALKSPKQPSVTEDSDSPTLPSDSPASNRSDRKRQRLSED